MKTYFKTLTSGFKIPTWYGTDIKLEFEQNSGLYLSNERTVPSNGLVNVGISQPLLQGLFIDQRRTAIKQAKVFQQANENERLIMLNNLFFDASLAYINWQLNYETKNLYEKTAQILQERLNNIKKGVDVGDRPAIDSVDAKNQLISVLIQYNNAELEYQKSSLNLSNFLWSENLTPVEITSEITPTSLSILSESINLDEFNESFVNNNPSLLKYDFKERNLLLENRMKREKLKPKLNLNYNLLSQPLLDYPTPFYSNYKWGFYFSQPIYLRTERADLRLNEIKIADNKYQRTLKKVELSVKLQNALRDVNTAKKQVNFYEEMRYNSDLLYKAEVTKYDIGESSMFLINSRQMKLIDAEVKALDNRFKLLKSYLYYKNLQTSFSADGF